MDIVRALVETNTKLGLRLKRGWVRLIQPIERRRALDKRKRLVGRYIGITGSCGKSTTTYLLGALLAPYGSTSANLGRNTVEAIYRSLRKLRKPVGYLVQEMSGHAGASYLRALCDDVRPDVAVVTAVGREHWKTFKSLEAIIEAKSQLPISVRAHGISCLNADDPNVAGMAANAGGRVILFGRSRNAHVRAENVSAHWPQRLAFELVIGERRYSVQTRFAGTIMLTNILAALAVVDGLGLDLAQALAVLAKTEPVREHLSVHEAVGGHTFILDTDKAPLWSTEKLMDDLPALRGDRPLVVVLSQLSETGGNPSAKYRGVIRQAMLHADWVVLTGKSAEQGVKFTGPGSEKLRCVRSFQEVAAALGALPPSLVLVKAAGVDHLARLWLATYKRVTCFKSSCELKITCQSCALLSRAGPRPAIGPGLSVFEKAA